MKANSLEELVTNSNIAGELWNYTDWHTRLVKFAQLVADWQKEQDLEEASPLSVAYANRCFENGRQAMKEQMLKDAVEGTVMDFSSNLPRPQVDIRLDPHKYHTGDKVRIVVLKAEKE